MRVLSLSLGECVSQEVALHAQAIREQEEEADFSIAIARSMGLARDGEGHDGHGLESQQSSSCPSTERIEQTLPTMRFADARGFMLRDSDADDKNNDEEDSPDCSICLCEFEPGEMIKVRGARVDERVCLWPTTPALTFRS